MGIDKASKNDVFNAAKAPGIDELLREDATVVRAPHKRERG